MGKINQYYIKHRIISRLQCSHIAKTALFKEYLSSLAAYSLFVAIIYGFLSLSNSFKILALSWLSKSW